MAVCFLDFSAPTHHFVRKQLFLLKKTKILIFFIKNLQFLTKGGTIAQNWRKQTLVKIRFSFPCYIFTLLTLLFQYLYKHIIKYFWVNFLLFFTIIIQTFPLAEYKHTQPFSLLLLLLTCIYILYSWLSYFHALLLFNIFDKHFQNRKNGIVNCVFVLQWNRKTVSRNLQFLHILSHHWTILHSILVLEAGLCNSPGRAGLCWKNKKSFWNQNIYQSFLTTRHSR